MTASQLAILFILAVILTALSSKPEQLIAIMQHTTEDNLMIKQLLMYGFTCFATPIISIWCGIMANGTIPTRQEV
ncbi:hypothetical protein EXN22_17910 [Pseudomonas tructae]|uniref:Uncharacterized protein n=1 Tax=Pseudomonas tructae TaxID=2518644 RepID=A0A411ML16_9PSED|nr:hypothetical protein [Pseudomonas tructae]QBF27467.1 hypothetical protein EXN22_17910 [Pseudomonas tructae]